jgi:tetratricopeptide (TPR) repeat protein
VRLAVAVVVAAVCVLGASSRSARADDADQQFKLGKKLLAERRYGEACRAFEKSDRLDPGIGAKLNVAKCYQEWGRLATAWRWFSDAERMARDSKDDRAVKIHALVEELDASVPRLTLKAAPDANTDGVVLKLDGVDIDVRTLGTERRVDPGPHVVEYIVNGKSRTRTVPVERGGSSEVNLELPRKPRPASTPTTAAAGKPGDDPNRTRRLVGLGASGVGGLLIVIAGVVTLDAHSDYQHALSGYCRGVPAMCDATGLARTRSARHRANIATGLTLGGAAVVAGGLYLYFTNRRVGSHGAEQALYVAPSVGDDGGGVVFGGAF